jgi:hypothetical protein
LFEELEEALCIVSNSNGETSDGKKGLEEALPIVSSSAITPIADSFLFFIGYEQ